MIPGKRVLTGSLIPVSSLVSMSLLRFQLSSVNETDRTARYQIYQILILSDTKPTWYQTHWILNQILNLSETYQMSNLSDTEAIRYRTHLIPNLSDTERIRGPVKTYQLTTYRILNFSDFEPTLKIEPIKYQTYWFPILNLQYMNPANPIRYQPIRCWSHLISSLSENRTYQIPCSVSLPVQILRWLPTHSSIPCGETGGKTGPSQFPPPLPAHDDRNPLPACSVAKLLTKKIRFSPILAMTPSLQCVGYF